VQKRNWKEYNEHLVRREEILFSIDFLENWNEEIEKMNNGKKRDLTIIHKVSWHLRYCTTGFNSKNKSTFIQSDKKKSCENTDLYKLKESKDDFIAVDSSGVKVANRGEWMREK